MESKTLEAGVQWLEPIRAHADPVVGDLIHAALRIVMDRAMVDDLTDAARKFLLAQFALWGSSHLPKDHHGGAD